MRNAVAAVVAGIALVAGCGGESGTAQPVAERWDPCSIPQDAIAGTGLDPGYKDVGWSDGIVVDDWSRCRFRGPAMQSSYFFNVRSSDVHTVSEARGNSSYVEVKDLKVGERDAFRYTSTSSAPITNCNVAVEIPSGVVVFTVNSMSTTEIGADPCDLVVAHASDLEPLLPSIQK